MKRSVYILGIFCLALVLMGTIFKVSHLQGASILLTSGLVTLSLVFLPLAYFHLNNSTNDKLLKLVYLLGCISFLIVFVGVLFKLMHWPGASILLVVGLPIPFVLFLPAYIYYHIKRQLKTDGSFFGILFFMVYLAVFTSMLATSSQRTPLQAYAYSTTECSKSNAFLSQNLKDTSKTKQEVSSAELIEKIEQIKLDLIRSVADANTAVLNVDGEINYFALSGKDRYILLEVYDQVGFSSFNSDYELFVNQIKEYKSTDLTKRLFQEIDEYRLVNPNYNQPILMQLPLITALSVLTDWQNKLLLITYQYQIVES